MNRQGYDLTYDELTDRWVVHKGPQTFGLHCGECFELRIGNRSISCRLEYGQQWYVVIDDTRLNLRIWDTYKVKI